MTENSSIDPITLRRIGKQGLTAHDPDRACQGYVLFSPLNDTKMTVLIDMDGNEVHRWEHDCEPGNYGYLLPNGNLFFNAKIDDEHNELFPRFTLFKGGALREIDWDGNIVWEHRDTFHHHEGRRLPHGGAIYPALEIVPDELARSVKGGVAVDGPMRSDVVREVDAQGDIIWEWHSKDHLDPEIDDLDFNSMRFEWPHLNAAMPIDDDTVLMSARNTSTVFTVDRKSGAITRRWGRADGLFFGQHDPKILPNGNMLLFDNGSSRHNAGVNAFSRALEFDMSSNEIVWQYQDNPNFHFQSSTLSGVDPLPNGNVLIAEGTRGRIFQVTREGDVVWEYVNPHYAMSGVGAVWNAIQKARFYTRDQIPALA